MSACTSAARGFTLLEVMVAVAILGLGLTAILSAEFGSVKAVAHARGVSVAVGLARCKMTELEQHLQKDGFQETDEHDTGPCCGDATPGYFCEWRVDKPLFPDGSSKMDLDTNNLDPSKLGGLGKVAQNFNGPGLTALGQTDSGTLDFDAGTKGLDNLTQMLGPGAGQAVQGGVGGIAAMAMTLVYPALRLIFEQSSRRVTLSIHWDEGGRDYNFDVIQWLSRPTPPLGADGLPNTGALSGAPTGGSGAPGATGATGATR